MLMYYFLLISRVNNSIKTTLQHSYQALKSSQIEPNFRQSFYLFWILVLHRIKSHFSNRKSISVNHKMQFKLLRLRFRFIVNSNKSHNRSVIFLHSIDLSSIRMRDVSAHFEPKNSFA